MATRNRLDINQLAKSVVEQATGEVAAAVKKKDGRSAGGIARMSSLNQSQKSELSQKAASAKKMKRSLTSDAPAVKKTRISV